MNSKPTKPKKSTKFNPSIPDQSFFFVGKGSAVWFARVFLSAFSPRPKDRTCVAKTIGSLRRRLGNSPQYRLCTQDTETYIRFGTYMVSLWPWNVTCQNTIVPGNPVYILGAKHV